MPYNCDQRVDSRSVSYYNAKRCLVVLFVWSTKQPRYQVVLHLRACQQPLHSLRRNVDSSEVTDRQALRRCYRRLGQLKSHHSRRIQRKTITQKTMRGRLDGFRQSERTIERSGHSCSYRNEQINRRHQSHSSTIKVLPTRELWSMHSLSLGY